MIKVKRHVVVLVCLTFNTFHILLWCFYCWLWRSKCWLGSLWIIYSQINFCSSHRYYHWFTSGSIKIFQQILIKKLPIILKILQIHHSEELWGCPVMPWHTHLTSMYESICCFYGCLSTYKKSTSYLNIFLRHETFKSPAILLVESILGHYSRTWILPGIIFAVWKVTIYINFQFRLFSGRSKGKRFKKYAKYIIFMLGQKYGQK